MSGLWVWWAWPVGYLLMLWAQRNARWELGQALAAGRKTDANRHGQHARLWRRVSLAWALGWSAAMIVFQLAR
ncbi:hypothetical protein ACFYNO_14255 [Kitasatospora sp. NPDC006697]|uniref:hypothetical protein n=1 Tax=unclassified Kitasatospora TaxID=2633591 RepID=UPI0036A4C6C3